MSFSVKLYPEMPALKVIRHFSLRISVPTCDTCEKCKKRFKINPEEVEYYGLCSSCINEISKRNLFKCSSCKEYKLLKQFSLVCVDCELSNSEYDI